MQISGIISLAARPTRPVSLWTRPSLFRLFYFQAWPVDRPARADL